MTRKAHILNESQPATRAEGSDARSTTNPNCPLLPTLELLGERWAFLILRDAFNGICHFDTFQQNLGIARNILTQRLTRLVERGVFERRPCGHDRRRIEYLLTEKGKALFPVLIALRQWGEQWESNDQPIPALVDRRHARPLRQVEVLADDGRPLSAGDVRWADMSDR